MSMKSGSNALPTRHLSIRVPWHDSAWNGTVCRKPSENAACLVLQRIRESRNDHLQEQVAGRPWYDLQGEELPPCVTERAGFMAPFDFDKNVTHPYSQFSDAHKNFLPTRLRFPKYSAQCVPYRWLAREEAKSVEQEYEIPIQHELEERADTLLGFKTAWMQDKRNQLALTDTFFSAIQPAQSLAFFYAKQVPLAEDSRRVLVGVGRVTHVGESTEYGYSAPGKLQSILWERPVQHSIRPGFADGFLLPYQQIWEKSASLSDDELRRCVAFASDDHRLEFSYVSELVGHDGAISALLSCADAVRECTKHVEGPWDRVQAWIDERLAELWRMRGPCPGLGAALTAFGVPRGTFFAYYLSSILQDNEDPWPAVERAFENPSSLPPEWSDVIGRSTAVAAWKQMPRTAPKRRDLLKLLSRFDLTAEQAKRFYHESEREKAGIDATERDLLDNPYRLYELDRMSKKLVSVYTVDRGLFPDPIIREAHPLPQPSRVDDALDPRRVRAFTVTVLEGASENGDTLWPRNRVVQTIRDLPLQPECPVSLDIMDLVDGSLSPEVSLERMADESPAYQLSRLSEVGKLIRGEVDRRAKGKRHEIEADWARLLEAALGGPAAADDEPEKQARREKVAALQELATSRISVLIGPAGTGKTTLLSVLCGQPAVKSGGVTLLAPTGKARVQMEKRTKIPAQTIAQFLLKEGRYDVETGRYHLSKREKVRGARTLVIDEASMLTEEQLASVLDALSGIERLILVGDPRQLPPIGSGRPFVDIVERLSPKGDQIYFPRVAPGYAELTIRRRQAGFARDDLLLAEWFSGQYPGAGGDEIWERVHSSIGSPTLRFVPWSTPDDLQERLLDVLVEELKLEGRDDVAGFEQSLGGSSHGNWIYFHRGRNAEPGAAARVERWQVLSPVRGQPHGVADLNRFVQRHFRARMHDSAHERWRKVPRPFGPEEILYGDKVINTVNKRRKHVFPDDGALQYVANGEIGMVVGQFKGRNAKYARLPWKLEVEFSSQPGYSYDYMDWEFGEEGNPPLELAYAITVHKSQGSEFGTTFLVLSSPLRMQSRELLYTALTRQRDKVIILHQGELSELKRYASDLYSETARRLTNLFGPPTLVPVHDRFLENKLIHRTRRGELVRSKSEVAIADLLFTKQDVGLEYEYEKPLTGQDGATRYPDFTVEDAAMGLTVYWEHLGMMHDPGYRDRWERKLVWYREQGIVPREEGGGPNGTLLITRDDERGGIDVQSWEVLLGEVFGI